MASKKAQAKVQSPGVKCWEDRKETDCMFTGRAIVHCNLPLKVETITVLEKRGPVKRFASKYVRESGPFRVKILADEEFGVPYGKDRLFLFWLITQAVRNKSKIVYYNSVRNLLESLGLAYGSHNRDWLRGALNRILHSTLFLEYNNGHVHGVDKDTILRRVAGVLDPKLKKGTPYIECYFELSTDFFRELVEETHAIPFDMEVIRRLGDNYGAMDLYVWWNHRLFTENDSHPYFYVPICSLKEQFSSSKEMPLFKFKQSLKKRIKEVNAVIKQVYGINPKLEALKDKLCFPLLPPLIEVMEKQAFQKSISPAAPNADSSVTLLGENQNNTTDTPTIEDPQIRGILERVMASKKLST